MVSGYVGSEGVDPPSVPADESLSGGTEIGPGLHCSKLGVSYLQLKE